MTRKLVKLGSVCDLKNGFAFKSNLFKEKGHPILRISNIQNERIDTRRPVYFDVKDYKIDFRKYEVNNGDLLIAMSGATTGKIGFNESQTTFYLNQRVGKLVPGKDLDKKYLYYLLSTKVEENLKISKGAAQPNLSSEQIKNIEFNLPSIPEQQHIVAKLDAAFAEIDKMSEIEKNKIKNINKFNSEFISEQIKKLSDKNSKKLSEICLLTRGPFGGSLTKSMFVQDGYAIYEQKHAIRNNFENIKYFINEKKFNEMKRFELKSGDLLMSCSGTMGKIAIVPKNIKKGIINQALLKISPNENVILKEYLKLIISSNYFQKLLLGLSSGAAQVNVPSVKILKNIIMPVPSIDLQKEILKKISLVENLQLENLYKKRETLINLLKASIIKSLMNQDNIAA